MTRCASTSRCRRPSAASRGGAQSGHELVRRLLAPFSVRQKLLAVVLLTTLTALLVAIAVMVGFDLRNYRQSLISDMTTQADLLGRTTAPALTFDDPRVAQENLELLHYRPQIRAAAIYNARGKIFARYSNKGEAELPKLPRLTEPASRAMSSSCSSA